jgi:hypothetical protein
MIHAANIVEINRRTFDLRFELARLIARSLANASVDDLVVVERIVDG